ncbi:Rrf2 family transcriptional regulator [candidate division WWE3 bacterium CG08_land_8_20_14_0_20_43_13]|uniref:Rrf2 family transcriptional regulator n=1 Tax=candidate division WWE3 bacterium CG08_land_8_20_14_0_20_43_13 TaxID=1975087 RepID=A0A2H0X7F5_UNCKA|nr:MAG: Rrf2 family transcriptional regulator [candidate division WWE3 bacterium CG08_land_8_20_14_0_20_43_13]
MNFSTKSEYGLRALTILARQYGKGPYSLADIAKTEEVSLPYLERLFAKLRSADIVESTRGAQGGYQLSRSPELINIYEVVRTLDGYLVPAVCVFETGPVIGQCKRVQNCRLRGVWRKVQDRLEKTLREITLMDLVEKKPVAKKKILPKAKR